MQQFYVSERRRKQEKPLRMANWQSVSSAIGSALSTLSEKYVIYITRMTISIKHKIVNDNCHCYHLKVLPHQGLVSRDQRVV